MHDVDRISVLGLGVAASAHAFPLLATAQTPSPGAGKELAPGVRQIDYGERDSLIPANKKEFIVKKGDVWTCAKGLNTEGTKNKGSAVAVMRIIDLLTA